MVNPRLKGHEEYDGLVAEDQHEASLDAMSEAEFEAYLIAQRAARGA